MKMRYTAPTGQKDLLSIKEFSELSGIEQSTLRYWDDIGLFRPARRHEGNSYRFYSPDQVISVNFIKVLSSLNIPLKVISNICENRSPETILRLMEQQETFLDSELRRLQEAYSTIHILRGLIKQGMDVANPKHISVETLEHMPIALGPAAESWKDRQFYQSFRQYCKQTKGSRMNINNPIGGCFASMESFLAEPSAPSRFFSVDPMGEDARAAGKYLVGYAQGYYGEMGDTPRRMADYAIEHHLTPEGPVYVFYLLDEISVKEPSEYLAQVCVAVR